MKKQFILIVRCILIYNIFFLFGFIKQPPSLTFGYGLGDLGLLFIYELIFTIYFVLSFWKIKNINKWQTLFILIGVLVVVMTILQLTLFRGSEYPLSRGLLYSPS